MEHNIFYFEQKGKQNTETALELARDRAAELGIGQVVLASTHGYTALKAAEAFKGSKVELIAVSISGTFGEEGWTMLPEERSEVEAAGIRVLTSLHTFADGISEAYYGQATPGTVIADTLRWFSQGMKVAVEISIMALEAGLISPDREIIALGGTDEGADTAIVLRAAPARKAKQVHISEILCKPR